MDTRFLRYMSRQTDRQTDILMVILRNPDEDEVTLLFNQTLH